MLSYRDSLNGFHNPYSHKGLTPEEFLKEYVKKTLKGRFSKRDGADRARLYKWIHDHWDDQVKFVYRLFPNTLKK